MIEILANELLKERNELLKEGLTENYEIKKVFFNPDNLKEHLKAKDDLFFGVKLIATHKKVSVDDVIYDLTKVLKTAF